MKDIIKTEAAVSEAIGFVLTLGIVLLASGIIYAGGLPILQKSMESTHFMEMEESFMLLGQNINEVAYERGPVRSTELKILDGTMSLNRDSTIRILVNGNTSTYYPGSVEYYLDNQVIGYENGGIWIKYRNNDTIMRSRPQLSYSNVTVIPVVQIMGGPSSMAGESTVRIRAKYSDSSYTDFINETGDKSTITITSSFYKGWKTYLEDYLGADDITVYDTNQTVSGTLTTSHIYVDVNVLNMEII